MTYRYCTRYSVLKSALGMGTARVWSKYILYVYVCKDCSRHQSSVVCDVSSDTSAQQHVCTRVKVQFTASSPAGPQTTRPSDTRFNIPHTSDPRLLSHFLIIEYFIILQQMQPYFLICLF